MFVVPAIPIQGFFPQLDTLFLQYLLITHVLKIFFQLHLFFIKLLRRELGSGNLTSNRFF